MDAVGDFVVVWQSDSQDADGSAGIYARRFTYVNGTVTAVSTPGADANGVFQVNTTYTNNQSDPAVAMDDSGNFVVVWATAGQTASYFNDVHGQMYSYSGQKIGGEFLANQTDLPGGAEVNPAVAINDSDQFRGHLGQGLADDQRRGDGHGGDGSSVRPLRQSAARPERQWRRVPGERERGDRRAESGHRPLGPQLAGGDGRLGQLRGHLGIVPGRRPELWHLLPRFDANGTAQSGDLQANQSAMPTSAATR